MSETVGYIRLIGLDLEHGFSNILWQRATPIIVDLFAGHKWGNNNKWYT